MLDEEVGTDERYPLAVEVGEVERKVEQESGKEGDEELVKQRQDADQQEEVDRVEQAEADIGDRLLDRQQLVEVAEHPADIEATGPLDVEEVVVDVDQDAAGGKEKDLLPVQERGEGCGGNAGDC